MTPGRSCAGWVSLRAEEYGSCDVDEAELLNEMVSADEEVDVTSGDVTSGSPTGGDAAASSDASRRKLLADTVGCGLRCWRRLDE